MHHSTKNRTFEYINGVLPTSTSFRFCSRMDARGALAERGFLALRSRDTENTPQWSYVEEAEV